jgi:hypothetical protein
MNWHQAVTDANSLCIQLALRSVDHRRWPIGGWGPLPDCPESRPELRSRIERLLASGLGNSFKGKLLAEYLPTIVDAPAAVPIDETTEAEVTKAADIRNHGSEITNDALDLPPVLEIDVSTAIPQGVFEIPIDDFEHFEDDLKPSKK